MTKPAAFAQFFAPHVDEQTPRFVVADSLPDFYILIRPHPGFWSPRRSAQQAFTNVRQHVGLHMIDEPTQPAYQRR